MPLLAIFVAAIAIVSYSHDSPYQILTTLYRMSKRTRDGAALPASTSNNTLHIPWNKTYQHISPAATSSSTTTIALSQTERVLLNPLVTLPREKVRQDKELRENRHGDKVCEMCSDSSSAVRHHHFSSTTIRRRARTGNTDQTFVCPVCKAPEPVTLPATETRKVVMADSSLYGVWDKMSPSKVHFEIDSIVGGRVRDMTRALTKNYLHLPNRLVVIVVAGINNIGAGEKAEHIFEEVLELKKVLKEHSEKWRHSPPSLAVFCTVVYAPKFCSLSLPPPPTDPEVAEWVPTPNFSNKFAEIKRLNDLIIDMTRAENLDLVRLDYHGVKRLRTGTMQHKYDNRSGVVPVWKEKEVRKKLHFTMELKVKVIEHIKQSFAANIRKQAESTGHD